jgi:nucleotide-binding universal stress UspA family protein
VIAAVAPIAVQRHAAVGERDATRGTRQIDCGFAPMARRRIGPSVLDMTRTILVGAHLARIDGDAVNLAVELARPFGARVVLGGVNVPAGDDVLDELLAMVPADVPASTEIIDSTSVVRGLHDLAVACGAELLVLGARHRGGLLRALHGDRAADITFTAPCGVAVTHPARTSGMPQRVGVAWDQSPEASEALEWAVQLVERTGGELTILRVLDPRHREGTHPGEHDQVRLSAAEEAARLRIAAHARVLWGNPAPELTAASHELDLLVMGSRAHGPVRRAVLGSVSAHLLHEAHCPVVVMPSGIHAAPDTAIV